MKNCLVRVHRGKVAEMCGIAGILLSKRVGAPLEEIISEMSAELAHRGPDSGGVWADNFRGVGLAHRRLSIVDTSNLGNQPMASRNGRFTVVYNGEIYNHLELRKILETESSELRWKGHSDTETLVEAIATWGVDRTLVELVGMFAIAVWDSTRHELTLARDRLGEKPLYFGQITGTLVFASELKAMQRWSGWSPTISARSVASFMRNSYVPEPDTIFENVSKVPAGTRIVFRQSDLAQNTIPEAKAYWKFEDVAEMGLRRQSENIDLTETSLKLEELLAQSIRGQLMGDVPVGAFLSGGIDSSTVVALMQKLSSNPVKTFSIGFENKAFDESQKARAIAKHLGTDHLDMKLSSRDADEIIRKLPQIYDEPFADDSQIPTIAVAQLAKEKVSVTLSGDGGDELFAGYRRYFLGAKYWNQIEKVPLALRRLAGMAMISSSTLVQADILDSFARLSPTGEAFSKMTGYLLKAGRAISSRSSEELFLQMSATGDPNVLMREDCIDPSDGVFEWTIKGNRVHQMMARDTVDYLPGDILVKVDRASMSQSLESRMPFLDHRVVEFAWSLPLSVKLDKNRTKLVLRSVLERYVPPSLTAGPKMGFGTPIGEWLKGPLKVWAEDLLSRGTLEESGFLNPVAIRESWHDHLSGKSNHQYALWNVLMFQAWFLQHTSGAKSCE